MKSVYIGYIECPPSVIAKINSKHGVTEDDVRAAAQWPNRPIKIRWLNADLDPRGPRLRVDGASNNRVIQITLYPIDEYQGTWRLGTAVPLA